MVVTGIAAKAHRGEGQSLTIDSFVNCSNVLAGIDVAEALPVPTTRL